MTPDETCSARKWMRKDQSYHVTHGDERRPQIIMIYSYTGGYTARQAQAIGFSAWRLEHISQ